MPDWLVSIISILRRDIFSVKSMLILLAFFFILFIAPAEIGIKFNEKIKIPFSYEIAVFATSFILCSFIYSVVVNFKKFYISLSNKKQLNKERNKLRSLISSLNNKEKEVISFLLNSGYMDISFQAEKIPNHVTSLINKGLIYQTNFAFPFSPECDFALEPSIAKFIRDEIQKNGQEILLIKTQAHSVNGL